MSSKVINRRDLDFILFELLKVEELTRCARFADHTRETFSAALDTALDIAEEKFATHNRKSDENEPQLVSGQGGSRVQIIPEVKEALDAYVAAGFIAAGYDYELGGMQLPFAITMACCGIFRGANAATDAYGSLTTGAANVIHAYGTPEQKSRYLVPMLAGRAFGTMVLTEPQAGSSLADIKTTATPHADGTYRIKGSKIFISAGDHELSENIVHLVLARLPDAPAGVKGISLFIAPKFRFNADGSRGQRNDVALAGLIHKMGYCGTTSAMLNFGEQDECAGELLGPPNQGLACMFHMMNEARISVGVGSVMLGYTAYLHALAYARDRAQGRIAKDPVQPQVPIIQHADVRRMLLTQKAYVEGGLSLALYASLLADRQQNAPTESERKSAGLLLDLLTPVVKSWPSQFCLEANSLAIQVHGGYGYTREYAPEQFYRDNRLNAIHEGTNGIQALDLLGRKVFLANGIALTLLGEEMQAAIAAAQAIADVDMQRHAAQLADAWADVVETTAAIAAVMRGDSKLALANANTYLEMFGHTVVAWMWLRQAIAAYPGKNGVEADFYQGKLATARYFFRSELPKTAAQHELVRALDAGCLEMQEAWF